MATSKPKMVHCRYPKCSQLHESTELLMDDAVKSGSKNSYYHSDCYHIMQTVNEIKDTFYREVNPLMTGKQIGQLVSIVNNMVFTKNVDVDLILFAIKYFVKYKPGALKYPGGISYIVQDKDMLLAWKKREDQKIINELKKQQKTSVNSDEFKLDIPSEKIIYNNHNKSKFSNVLGV